MTTTTTTAYSELTRVLPWSLRALGYSFPVADRASHLIATAAALDPSVLDSVGRIQQRPTTVDAITIDADGVFRIDANGRGLFESGPAVIDFIGALTPKTGVLRGEITDVTELALAPALLLIAADYGLSCVALVIEADARRWFLATSDEGSRVIVGGETVATLHAVLSGADETVRATATNAFNMECDRNTCLLVATRQMVSLETNSTDATTINAEDRLHAAHSRGIPITVETLRTIYDLEKRTWAPTSERSRAQAGFQQPVGGAA